MGAAAASGRFPLLALVLAVFMVGYVMWQADRLPALARYLKAIGRRLDKLTEREIDAEVTAARRERDKKIKQPAR